MGAGAVGQVYGYHLQRGGARVSFLVKEKYADEARAGFTLYPLDRSRRWRPVRFDGFGVHAGLDGIAGRRWDQVWLCVSSTALRGDWLGPFLDAVADAELLVMLQPGLEDRELLAARFPVERLVAGMIALIAFQAPLPGHDAPDPPGVAYWLPPGAPSPFGGSGHLVGGVVDALRLGGCPAVEIEDVALRTAVGAAAMMPLIVGLEIAGWSLSALRAHPVLETAAAAARQAMAVAAAHHGAPAPAARNLVRPGLLRPVVPLLPRIFPFDLETYLRYHFTKVGDQTRQMLAAWSARGRAVGLPVDAVEALAGKLAERDRQITPAPAAPGRSAAG